MTATREIPLTRGYVAIVDAEDFDRVAAKKWATVTGPKGDGARAQHYWRENGKVRAIGLGPFILQPAAGLLVDHINGDPLDNRRCNLRACTHEQNMRNRRKHGGSCSNPYKGVHPNRHGKTWFARIRAGSDNLHLGNFATPEAAAQAYDAAAVRLHGEFARLNFPAANDANAPARQTKAAA